MPPQSATPAYTFATSTALALEATFDGGRLTSDGGLPWLAEAEDEVGICAALAACVPEWRRGPVRHSLAALVRQRVFQIACGYEDQNDAATLRSDPLLKLVCGRLPDAADLASRSSPSALGRMAGAGAQRRPLCRPPRPCAGWWGSCAWPSGGRSNGACGSARRGRASASGPHG